MDKITSEKRYELLLELEKIVESHKRISEIMQGGRNALGRNVCEFDSSTAQYISANGKGVSAYFKSKNGKKYEVIVYER